MKLLLVLLVSMELVAPVLADQNPYLAIYLNTAADGSGENEICPAINGIFNVYVCFDRFGEGGGMLGAAFMFVRTFAGFKLLQTNLLPGLDFGDVEVDGWAITAGANCQYPVDGTLVGASIQYLYLGQPGVIEIVSHPIDGNSAADCDNLLDFWCVASLDSHIFSGNFGVCMPPPAAAYSSACEPLLVPVEGATWGGIKALYR